MHSEMAELARMRLDDNMSNKTMVLMLISENEGTLLFLFGYINTIVDVMLDQ